MEEYNSLLLAYEAAIQQWKKDAAKGNGGKPPEKPQKPDIMIHLLR